MFVGASCSFMNCSTVSFQVFGMVHVVSAIDTHGTIVDDQFVRAETEGPTVGCGSLNRVIERKQKTDL